MANLRDRLPATRVSIARGATGLLLSLGCPLGWIAIQWLRGVPPNVEVPAHPMLYAYLFVSAAFFVTSFGYALGRVEERLRRTNDLLLTLSITDDLTGLQNARMFHHELPRMYSLARRAHLPLSLIMLDLDHFKRVNDSHGHAAGDAVLRGVGRVVRESSRKEDLVARVGGEEIVLVLPGVDREGARTAAERLRAGVAALAFPEVPGLKITLSAGVAALREDDTPETLFERADAALYAAKSAGRDRVEG